MSATQSALPDFSPPTMPPGIDTGGDHSGNNNSNNDNDNHSHSHDHAIHPSTIARLGMDAPARIPVTTAAGFGVGLFLGASHGINTTALRYRAENAHRLPRSSLGWYQYHRSKNYRAMVGGLRDGVRMGAKLGAATLVFAAFEEIVDHARHGRGDFCSTLTAGLSFSGVYSLFARHDIYTAARTVKLGLRVSLVYGLAQDALATAKGHPPGYIARIQRHFGKE